MTQLGHYLAEVTWQRDGQAFVDGRYSRRHMLRFDGGLEIPGSSSPHVVPPPMSDAAALDPEEAFVASLASCHMLWFLSISARNGYVIDRYSDSAAGTMEPDSEGKLAMTRVVLRPRVTFSGDATPTRAQVERMHHLAHEQCFIARSVKSQVECEPVHD